MRAKLLSILIITCAVLLGVNFVYSPSLEAEKTLKIERIYATSTNLPFHNNHIFNCFDGDFSTTWSPMQGSGPNEGVMIYLSEPIWVRKVEMFDTEGKRMGGIRAYCDRGAWIDTEVKQLFIKIGDQYESKRLELDTLKGEYTYQFDADNIVQIGEIKIYGKDGKPLQIELPKRIRGSVEASSSLSPSAAYGPNNLIDNNKATAWSEGLEGLGIGSKLTFSFNKPRSITKIKLWNGYQRSEKHFHANARAKSVQILADGVNKGTFTLKDIMGPQSINLSKVITNATKIEIKIRSGYDGTAYKDLLISDVLFIDGNEPLSIENKNTELLIQKNSEHPNRFLKRIMDRNIIYNIDFTEEKNQTWRTHREGNTILLRSNGTFVSYLTTFEYFETLNEAGDMYSTESIAEGSWTIHKESSDKIIVKVFGRVYTPNGGREAYVGNVSKNNTLKIFKEYLTITQDKIVGEKYIGSFRLDHE